MVPKGRTRVVRFRFAVAHWSHHAEMCSPIVHLNEGPAFIFMARVLLQFQITALRVRISPVVSSSPIYSAIKPQ